MERGRLVKQDSSASRGVSEFSAKPPLMQFSREVNDRPSLVMRAFLARTHVKVTNKICYGTGDQCVALTATNTIDNSSS